MGNKAQKFLIHLAISAVVAAATPAIAAGLVTGASMAATAGETDNASTIVGSDAMSGGSINSETSPVIATHGPARLSALAGTDDKAWASAHEVHVVPPAKKHVH